MLSFTALLAITRHVTHMNDTLRPRRLYTPQNPILYNAAYAGYIGGICQARGYASSASIGYAELQEEATAFASAVDGLIPTDPSANSAKASLLEGAAAFLVSLRGAAPLSLAAVVTMVAALYMETSSGLQPAGSGIAASEVSYVDTAPLLDAMNVQTAIDALKGGPPQRLTFADTGTALEGVLRVTSVFIDASGGQGTYPLPTAPFDGMTFEINDSADAPGSWGESPPILSVVAPRALTSPTESGSRSTVSQTALAQNGGSWTVRYGSEENTWFTI